MSEDRTSRRPGRLHSMLAGLVTLALARAELLGIEAEELLARSVGHLLVGIAAVVATLAGLTALLLLVMVAAPLPWRALLLGGLTLVFLLSALGLWFWLRQRLSVAPAWFSLTRSEVRKDWQVLSGKGAR